MNTNDLEELERIANANRSEYRRLIEDNRALHRDLAPVRAKYGFPLRHTAGNFGKVIAQWYDRQVRLRHPERVNELHQDLDALKQRYGIPDRWGAELQQLAMLGDVVCGPAIEMGFPSGSYNLQTRKHTFNIDRAAIGNPIVLDFIKACMRATRPRCPKPREGGPHGALDYEPVLEYYEKYHITHGVTYQDIADDLGVSERTVRNRLSAMRGTRL